MFSLFKPKLIQFGDGKYAIRKFCLFYYEYMDERGDWWMATITKFDNGDEAIDIYNQRKIADKCKVISTLDDEWDL